MHSKNGLKKYRVTVLSYTGPFLMIKKLLHKLVPTTKIMHN